MALKIKPAATPVIPKDATDQIKKRKGKDDRPLTVTLQVSGGVHSEKYDFDFQLKPDRNLTCKLDCKMSNRKSHIRKSSLKESEIRRIVAEIEESGILNSAEYRGQFIPCTLVGTLTVELGDRKYQTRYIVDPEQAKMQEANTKEADHIVDMVFSLAAKKMKLKSAKP